MSDQRRLFACISADSLIRTSRDATKQPFAVVMRRIVDPAFENLRQCQTAFRIMDLR
jgi:hypothetical protein